MSSTLDFTDFLECTAKDHHGVGTLSAEHGRINKIAFYRIICSALRHGDIVNICFWGNLGFLGMLEK